MRIMVVNNDQEACDFLTGLLASHGHQAVTWSRANGLMVQIACERPHLVVLDLQMEGDSTAGLRIIDELQRDRDLAHIPVILVSGDYFTLQAHRRALAAAPVVTVQKSFSPGALLLMIKCMALA